MKDSRIKIILLSMVSILVILILFSNIGQNFKIDISSYNEVVKHYKKMQSYSSKVRNYQAFLNADSNYIKKFMQQNKFEPLLSNNYIDSWSKNIPVIKGQTALEVYDRNNHLIKKYKAKSDYYQDFRGNITSGFVKSEALYSETYESINQVLKEILLFDGYNELKSNDEFSKLDTKLKSLGASGIISPIHTSNPELESGFYLDDLHLTKNSKGIAKLLVTPSVFEELNNFAEMGYRIKIRSAGEISSITYKNVYGVIKGQNPTFKPLVINVFYDGLYTESTEKFIANKNYLLPASLLLDCMRVINKQRMRRPDKTIILNFLCGYSKNLEGFKHYEKYLTGENVNVNIKNGSNIYLDGFGLKTGYHIEFGKSSSNLASNINYFFKKSDIVISSRKKNDSLLGNMIHIYLDDIPSMKYINIPNRKLIEDTNHALLSLIQDECYNINLLTGNFRRIRVFERNVRSHSAILSIIAISLLAIVLFKPKNLRNIINYK